MGGQDVVEGKIEGKEVSWVEVFDFNGNSIRFVYQGTISGDEIRLSRTVAVFGTSEATAKRDKQLTACGNAHLALPARALRSGRTALPVSQAALS